MQLFGSALSDVLALTLLLFAQIGLAISVTQFPKTEPGYQFFLIIMLFASLFLGIMDVLRLVGFIEPVYYNDVRRYVFRVALVMGAWGNWWINRYFRQG